jgi:hypothetical protein
MTLQVQRLAAGLIHEGITTAELVRFIDQAHRALGADNGSTFCIVQFGYATAYPHGIPGVQALRAGELVLIDTGCTVHGYHSDITRTYIFGEPRIAMGRFVPIWAAWIIGGASALAIFLVYLFIMLFRIKGDGVIDNVVVTEQHAED